MRAMQKKDLTLKEILLDVPWIGYETASQTEFSKRVTSCGMCCVATLLFNNSQQISLDDMIIQGITEGGFTINGWSHDYFVSLLKSRGFEKAHREQNMSYGEGVQKISKAILEGNPVIISGRKLFMEQMSFHMVLVVGVRLDSNGNVEGFYYSDPAVKSEEVHGFWYVSIGSFKQFWRQMAIFSA